MLCQRKLPDAQIYTCIRNNPFSRRKWRPQTHSSRLKQILLHLISKACCICISRPQYQLYSYTNSTINIRKLYRTCYDSATAYDSSAASCRISSQISPMSLITLSSLLDDNINHWMNLYPILLPFTMLLDGCIIILFSFTWFNRIDLQLSSLSRVVSYMTL